MKIHLRHTRTGQLLRSPNSWTEDPKLAYDFMFADRALEFAATWELSEVEVAFSFEAVEQPRSNIVPFPREGPFDVAA